MCHLSCCQDEVPYLIPISFGYDGQAIYIHTAKRGKKISIFENNPRVCLSFVSRADLIPDPNQACEWGFESSSVIAEGVISELIDPAEKVIALDLIMAHYSDREWDYPEKMLAATRTWKIILKDPTGKVASPDED